MRSASLALAALAALCSARAPGPRARSVLLIVADDLRAPLDPPFARLPNCGRLARRGFSFENAFAQQALCAPSRNSFLTSRSPNTLRLFDFYNYWRDFIGNFTTLPQYFKDNGYKTYSFGKIFHPGKSSNFTDDYPYSWSETPYHPSSEIYKQTKVCYGDHDGVPSRNLVCPVSIDRQPEKTLPDIQTANAAIEKLKGLKFEDGSPFFMAVGFHKPHVPLKFPKEYLKYYPLSNIPLPKMPFRPPTMPSIAWNPWTDVRERDDIKKLNISFPFGRMPREWTLKIIQSYYASVSYIDDLIGKIMQYIDLENTIVVLTSDHGWSLGEHGEWSKYSNFDIALKVPLIIYDPNYKSLIKNGVKIKHVIQLLDLFPTLAEISGITDNFPECQNKSTLLCTEGRSLTNLMKSAVYHRNVTWEYPAFSQYPRPNTYPTLKPNSDKPKLADIKFMGYSIRTARFRYTEWLKFNHTTFSPIWKKCIAKELYDHTIDFDENMNIENRRQLKTMQKYLRKLLKKNFK